MFRWYHVNVGLSSENVTTNAPNERGSDTVIYTMPWFLQCLILYCVQKFRWRQKWQKCGQHTPFLQGLSSTHWVWCSRFRTNKSLSELLHAHYKLGIEEGEFQPLKTNQNLLLQQGYNVWHPHEHQSSHGKLPIPFPLVLLFPFHRWGNWALSNEQTSLESNRQLVAQHGLAPNNQLKWLSARVPLPPKIKLKG